MEAVSAQAMYHVAVELLHFGMWFLCDLERVAVFSTCAFVFVVGGVLLWSLR